MLHAE